MIGKFFGKLIREITPADTTPVTFNTSGTYNPRYGKQRVLVGGRGGTGTTIPGNSYDNSYTNAGSYTPGNAYDNSYSNAGTYTPGNAFNNSYTNAGTYTPGNAFDNSYTNAGVYTPGNAYDNSYSNAGSYTPSSYSSSVYSPASYYVYANTEYFVNFHYANYNTSGPQYAYENAYAGGYIVRYIAGPAYLTNTDYPAVYSGPYPPGSLGNSGTMYFNGQQNYGTLGIYTPSMYIPSIYTPAVYTPGNYVPGNSGTNAGSYTPGNYVAGNTGTYAGTYTPGNYVPGNSGTNAGTYTPGNYVAGNTGTNAGTYTPGNYVAGNTGMYATSYTLGPATYALGVTLPGGDGSTAPVVAPVLVPIPIYGTPITVTVPPGGYVTIIFTL